MFFNIQGRPILFVNLLSKKDQVKYIKNASN